MVIAVILHCYRFNILEVSSLICVVEGRQNNTERKLFVLMDVILGLVIFPLFFGLFRLSKDIAIYYPFKLASLGKLLRSDACKYPINAIWIGCSFDPIHRLDDGVDVVGLSMRLRSWLVER